MMVPDKKIVWRQPDGAIAVTTPIESMKDGESEDAYLERIAAKAKDGDPDLALAQRVATIPGEAHRTADRYFRRAWAWTTPDPIIDIDMDRARSVKRDHLRMLRKPKMEALDVAYQRADEAGDAAQKQKIAQQKQVLRDVTADPAIDAANTPEELKAALPDSLK